MIQCQMVNQTKDVLGRILYSQYSIIFKPGRGGGVLCDTPVELLRLSDSRAIVYLERKDVGGCCHCMNLESSSLYNII